MDLFHFPILVASQDSQHIPVSKEELSSEQQERRRSPGVVQEQPQPPQINLDENREEHPLQPMETQDDVGDCGASAPKSRNLSKRVAQRKALKRKNVEEQTSPLSNETSDSQDPLESSEQPPEVQPKKKGGGGRKGWGYYKIEPIFCQVCREDVYDDMDRHRDEVHLGRKYYRIRCIYCDEGFHYKTKYYNHLKNCPTPIGENENRLAFVY